MAQAVRNPFARSDRSFVTPAGFDVVPEYMGVTCPNGARVRQKVGEHSLSEYVQSFLDGCLIENILRKCSLTGDYSSLRAGNAQYVDTTGLPRSFAEVQQAMAQARSLYHTLPSEALKTYPTFELFSEAILSDPSSEAFKSVYTTLGVIKAPDVAAAAVVEGGVSDG